MGRSIFRASFEDRRKFVRLIVSADEACAVVLHANGAIEIRGVLPTPGEPSAELRLTA